MTEKEKYLPFNAINEFMRDDYRLTVMNEVLGHLEKIPADQRNTINKLTSKYVTVQGFRNSNMAPAGRKAKASVDLFMRSAEYSAAVVEGWFRLHNELAATTMQVLSEKTWQDLQPIEMDRSKLPGFMIHWPKTDTFELIIQAVRAKNSFENESDDNISLMAVWGGLRLPYDLFVEEDTEEKAEEAKEN